MRKEKNRAASALGKLGGASRSEAKLQAVRANLAKARDVLKRQRALSAKLEEVSGTDHNGNESSPDSGD